MSHVHIAACGDYVFETVQAALYDGLGTLGVREGLIKPGQRVLLKPNLLQARQPERAATTHPALVAAVARWVRECGATPIIADSPGGQFSAQALRRLYEVTGMARAATEAQAELSYDTTSVIVPCPEGRRIKMLDLVKAIADADAIISLPKLKTHSLTYFTGATKNLFGAVPGVIKVGYHTKLPVTADFSDMLMDVLLHLRPVLTVMDAVVGMEGNGPSGGNPRHLGFLLLGQDGVALDVVATTIVGIPPLEVPPIAAAAQRGLTTGNTSDIELSGTSIQALAVGDFKKPQAWRRQPHQFPAPLRAWFSSQMLVSPQAGSRCTRCGVCVQNCPVAAVSLVNGRAHMDAARCIRCYCCHELCPHDAVELHQGLMGRLLNRIG